MVFILIAVPAAVFRARCGVGGCGPEPVKAIVPFCSLKEEVRTALAAGFREGRSPDVFMVTQGEGTGISAPGRESDFPWPTVQAPPTGALMLWGHGIDAEADVPADASADDLAPTLATLMGVERPHPEVRSGEPLSVIEAVSPPKLVVQIVWKGTDLDSAELASLLDRGTGGLRFGLGSAPADPAAVLTTIGTGGVPAQHGITGTLLRDQEGKVARPWSKAVPLSVIAGLGDDLDETTDQEALVGAILESSSEQGLVGGTWYLERDEDDFALAGAPEEGVRAFRQLLAGGYGADDIPDLVGIVQSGSTEELLQALGRIEAEANEATGGEVTFALISLPGDPDGAVSLAGDVEGTVDALATPGSSLVQAVVPGGIFLDQDELAAERLEDDKVIDALKAMTTTDGKPVFADVFPQIAISLGSFC